MGKNLRWPSGDLKKAGYIETPDGFKKASSLVNKGKVEKLPWLDNKIDFKTPAAYDGSRHRAIEIDEFSQWQMPKKAINLNPFPLPDLEVIDIKFRFDLPPFPAPRMSRSDQWRTDPHHPDPTKRQRNCVFRYLAWRDAFRAMSAQKGYVLGERLHVVFIFELPKSYSRKKRENLMMQYHKQRPDYDNCAKSIGDAFRLDDGYVCDVRVIKLWGPKGEIIIF